MQKLIRLPLVLTMKITGFRFGKEHRQNETLIYRVFNTVLANLEAGL